jgi:hypothetical protein
MSNIVTYTTANRLVKLGFNMPTIYIYRKYDLKLYRRREIERLDFIDNIHYISAPTVSEAINFIRKKYQKIGIFLELKISVVKPQYYGEMTSLSHCQCIATDSNKDVELVEKELLDLTLDFILERIETDEGLKCHLCTGYTEYICEHCKLPYCDECSGGLSEDNYCKDCISLLNIK